MEIKTSMGIYKVIYYWNSAEFEDSRERTGISLKFNGAEICFIKCSPLEKEEVLSKLKQ
jgi:hypothetical protein